jgi:3-oxoacyl-[acyl-carrier protein] reductase
MDLGLKAKKAIITGGTRGIGRAIVEMLGEEGCAVACCARNAEGVAKTVASLRSKGITAYGEAVNITDGEALKKWITSAADELGGLDILISSAGAMAQGVEEADWTKNLQLDILGAVNAIEAALPLLLASAGQGGDASIVAIGSTASVSAAAPSSYGAIKAALVHYIKGVARQNAPHRVRANVISPGMVYFEGGFWNKAELNYPEFFKTNLARNPLGRMARPEEIAAAAVFLSSPRSAFTSGVNLIVDGVLSDRVNY